MNQQDNPMKSKKGTDSLNLESIKEDIDVESKDEENKSEMNES